MGRLQQQYQQDSEDAYSIESMAHSLCEHPHLDKRDIVDKGIRVKDVSLVLFPYCYSRRCTQLLQLCDDVGNPGE